MVSCGHLQSPPTEPPPSSRGADVDQTAGLRAAVASPERPPQESARDHWRHPAETLEFFAIRSDQNVVELWPGAGWYTAILAPFLAEKGHLTVTSPEPKAPGAPGSPTAFAALGAKKYAERLSGSPTVFGKVSVRTFGPSSGFSLGPDASADLVVTFRNFHNWVHDGIAGRLLDAAFRVLKPGGVLGVEEHRAAEGGDPAAVVDRIDETGYVPESYVIALAKKAGFTLDARSEINANPRDTMDWPMGVWTLPPTLLLGEQDRAKYQEFGESDRMTLRFRKALDPREPLRLRSELARAGIPIARSIPRPRRCPDLRPCSRASSARRRCRCSGRTTARPRPLPGERRRAGPP